VGYADLRFADTAREAASGMAKLTGPRANRVWFEGHWGFQYYAEQAGLRPLDFDRSAVRLGDMVVVPQNNTNPVPLSEAAFSLLSAAEYVSLPWMATMGSGAGFYSDVFGPLPFALGRVPAEKYKVFLFARARGTP
jgi:hypothetical protein